MRDFRRYWTDPGYWRWRWQRIGIDTKLFVLLAVAASVGLGGYLSARELAGATEASGGYAPPVQSSQGIVTAQSTVAQTTQMQARGATPIRQRAVAFPVASQTIVQRVTGRVVTTGQTQTIMQSATVHQPVTVPGAVTNAVTRPVTVSGPTQTVTKEVTQPARTVTGPTRTVTNQETTTNTVNVPRVTVAVPSVALRSVTVAVPNVTVAVPTMTVPTVTVPTVTVPKP